MKLRIKGNSIRLRLTQSEVDIFGQTGRVADRTQFGPGQLLTYTLARDAERDTLTAAYSGDELTVFVPPAIANSWVSSEQTGFSGEIPLPEMDSKVDSDSGSAQNILRILVEKDFHCLVPRPHEDESDHYANPLAVKGSG